MLLAGQFSMSVDKQNAKSGYGENRNHFNFNDAELNLRIRNLFDHLRRASVDKIPRR